ncbi:NAD-dependent epimerase/dehydratase family protein [Halosegnis marinus]|uniref:NAD-dependent epimerase/dehydratase family protein n=1 Tax=Halosegnis marinus TaxID=3034023 RepID=A0ABD5ZRP5_9EURY|nr:NAD-dependent epimerase/dehydratase family protein [Halosegnis sp. DT85]
MTASLARPGETDAAVGDLAGRTVLVTGGAGFVGGHIARTLAGDAEVRVLDDLSAGRRERVPDDATLVEGDVRDDDALAEAMADADVVFHEAAMVSVPRSVEAPTRCHDVNTGGTLAVLERAREADARVVLASTTSVYGHPETTPVAESHPCEPVSPYGVSKLAADRYARLYHELYGLPTVALRYFNVYGPGQTGGQYSGVVTTFLEQARCGQPLTVHGDGEQTRDFVHIDDVVRANLAAATTDAVGEAFNVGTGTAVTVNQLAEHIRSATGATSPIQHTDAREGDVRHSCAATERAEEHLGFEAEVPLSVGLRDLLG